MLHSTQLSIRLSPQTEEGKLQLSQAKGKQVGVNGFLCSDGEALELDRGGGGLQYEGAKCNSTIFIKVLNCAQCKTNF